MGFGQSQYKLSPDDNTPLMALILLLLALERLHIITKRLRRGYHSAKTIYKKTT